MADSNDAALRDLPEALESQQPDGQRLHAVTLRVTHSGIFMKGRTMSDINETIYYKELQAGDAVHDGDQFRDVDGQWKPYIFKAHMGGKVAFGVTARRPIRATHQTTFEEVPDSRTLQQAVEQPQRERWAYEELRPGDVIQQGDEWQNPDGRWHPLVLTPGASMEVRDVLRARRPHNITALQKERDEARAEVKQLQAERQEFSARLEAEITAAALAIDELSAAKAALKSAQRARDELQRQVDELRAERSDEPTARQVQDMLRTWATELDWSADCFDSEGRDQINSLQGILIAVMERIESIVNPEGTSANA